MIIKRDKVYNEPRKFVNTDTQRKAKFYGMRQWRDLSSFFRMENPLCKCCSIEGITKEAEEVHHICKWDDQETDEMKTLLLLDKDNIVSLCRECHANIHRNKKALTKKQVEYFYNKQLEIKQSYEDRLIFIILK